MKSILGKAGKPSVHKLLGPYFSTLIQPAPQVQSFETPQHTLLHTAERSAF